MVARAVVKQYTLRDLERLFDWVEEDWTQEPHDIMGPRFPKGVRIIDDADDEWPVKETEDAKVRRLQGFQPYPIAPHADFERWCDEQYLCINADPEPGLYIDKQRVRQELLAAERASFLDHHRGDVDLPLLADPFDRAEFLAFAATPRFMTAAAWGPSALSARDARRAFFEGHMPRSAELLRVLDSEQASAEGKAVNQRVELILDALRLAGIDPTNPPRYKQGTAAPHKKAAWDALKDRMDRGAFDEAWQLCLDLNAIAKSMVKKP